MKNPVPGYVALMLVAAFCGFVPALLNLFIDPYELVVKRERSPRVEELAEKAHYPLWKLARYQKGRFDTLILGDSRARALQDKYWQSLGVDGAMNLAYGGGTLPEIHETFQYIKDDPALKTLIIGIQLRSFDEDHKQGMNRVPEAVSLINNPVAYIFNWSVAKTSLLVARADYPLVERFVAGLGVTRANAAQAGDLSAKFRRQIDRNARSDWRGFEQSQTYWRYLEEIGAWAKAKDRQVVFVVPPTIVQMQQTIKDHGLEAEDRELRERLARLGLVYDFDFPNPVTSDFTQFSDAYHFNSAVARQIVGELVLGLGASRKTDLRAQKRRAALRCPDISTATSDVMLEGANCRLWKGKTS